MNANIVQRQRGMAEICMDGVEVTPLQVIGTQRTSYTHRKNRNNKKIEK